MLCCNALGNIFRLAIVVGTIFALILQFLTVKSCDFLQVTNADETNAEIASLGVWFHGTQDGECVEGSYDAMDEELIVGARTALTWSLLFGAGALALVTFEWLCCNICCAGCITGFLFAGAWVMGSAVYMIYGISMCGSVDDAMDGADVVEDLSDFLPFLQDVPSGTLCGWSEAATYNLVAIVLYFGCGILLCFTPKPDPLLQQVSK
ncbi:hypothetical protein IV203_032711 [Nitzschia inconspicua]|uniref:Uncharacterized protein n=1 Tax=Nitzschia inconspicua TaxID=303405 RepID=A0A9K3KLD1_9STRA|nr:hypothetical protein IV203_032711 [Nitzschia inconspicua]